MVMLVLVSPAGPISAASALGGMPAVVPALPVAASSGVLPATATSPATTQASSGSSGAAATGGTDSATTMMALLSAVAGQGAHSSGSICGERVSIGHGLPTVPKSLFDKIQRWEFVDLAELLPSQSTHDQMIAAQSNFSWFELVRPKRRQIESITEWSKAYTVYTAVLLRRFPEQASELLAYHLLIIKAAQQYEGLQWRAYDTHFRVSAAASGNREWSKVDVDLYTRFFTGKAKSVSCCYICDSTLHLAANCPAKKREPQVAMQEGPSNPKRRRSWASDICALYNSGGRCSFGTKCKFRHICGECGGTHSAKNCSFLPSKLSDK